MPILSVRALEPIMELFIKDIAIDHIVRGIQLIDRAAFYRYFKGYRIQKLGKKRIIEMLDKEVLKGDKDAIAELMVTLWNQSNNSLFKEMLYHVKKIDENVEEIVAIEDDVAADIVKKMSDAWEMDRIFICVVINQVKFSPSFVKETFNRELPERPEEETEEETEVQPDAATSEPVDPEKKEEEQA